MSGIYLYCTGASADTFYVGYSNSRIIFNEESSSKCQFKPSESSRFMVRVAKNILYFSVSKSVGSDFEICSKVELTETGIRSFHLNMLAKSDEGSSFRIDVKSLILSTDVENLGISEFESKFDDNDHKLFRQIHFFQINKNETESYFKHQSQDIDATALNITTIYEHQKNLLSTFSYCNSLLEKNIESTDDIVTFIDQQQSAIDVYAKSMLDNMKSWMNDTKLHFELIDKDSKSIMSDFKALELDSEFEITHNLFEILKTKFTENEERFSKLKKYEAQIKKNVDFLKTKKNQFRGLPFRIRFLIKNIEENNNTSNDPYVLIALVSCGLIILIALLSIFVRLSKKTKYSTLGEV
jgi:hypothetical protein